MDSVKKMRIQNNFTFQSDNDPKHTSLLAKKWFSDNNVDQLEWPPQSPDLNIIEHLWKYLDDSVPANGRTSLAAFRTALFQSWDQIDKEKVEKLVESIPN